MRRRNFLASLAVVCVASSLAIPTKAKATPAPKKPKPSVMTFTDEVLADSPSLATGSLPGHEGWVEVTAYPDSDYPCSMGMTVDQANSVLIRWSVLRNRLGHKIHHLKCKRSHRGLENVELWTQLDLQDQDWKAT